MFCILSLQIHLRETKFKFNNLAGRVLSSYKATWPRGFIARQNTPALLSKISWCLWTYFLPPTQNKPFITEQKETVFQTCMGRGDGELQLPPPKKIWQPIGFWAARKLWAKPTFREVCLCVCVFFVLFCFFFYFYFFSKRDILYLKSAWWSNLNSDEAVFA